MRWILATALFSALVCLGAAQAADGCGPGCHNTVNGACVVDGWETGAVAWNECPVTSRARPPCTRPYVWQNYAKACVHPN